MKTYKPATPTKLGSKKTFSHDSRNKPGTPGAKAKIGNKAGAKYGKETLAHKDPVQAKLRKISKAMFSKQKATSPEGMMRAQLNG